MVALDLKKWTIFLSVVLYHYITLMIFNLYMSIRGGCPGGEDPGPEGDSGAQNSRRPRCEVAEAPAGGGRGPAGGAPPGG